MFRLWDDFRATWILLITIPSLAGLLAYVLVGQIHRDILSDVFPATQTANHPGDIAGMAQFHALHLPTLTLAIAQTIAIDDVIEAATQGLLGDEGYFGAHASPDA